MDRLCDDEISGLCDVENKFLVCQAVSEENAIASAVEAVMEPEDGREDFSCQRSDSEDGFEVAPWRGSVSAFFETAEFMRVEFGEVVGRGT